MTTYLVSPDVTPTKVGIGWRQDQKKIYAVSYCCGAPILYDMKAHMSAGHWICDGCQKPIRPCNLNSDPVRNSATEINSYETAYPLLFVSWWTGFAEEDINIEVVWS